MTLSRFLRDYVYIPLGGNRKGKARRHVNLLVTMLLGGLWHGAGWTFVLWGGLHGLYLVLNHAWRTGTAALGRDLRRSTLIGRICGRALTFLVVVIGWVFFRAETFDGAIGMLRGMAMANGAMLDYRLEGLLKPVAPWIEFKGWGMGTFGSWGVVWVAALGTIAFLAPNATQIMYRFKPAFEIYPGQVQRFHVWFEWRPTLGLACALAMVLFYTVTKLTNVSEFLYFQF